MIEDVYFLISVPIPSRIPVPIAEAYRQDPQTIRIFLKKPLTGTATIRYLYGAMPDVSNPVLDNSAMRLPLEEYQSIIR